MSRSAEEQRATTRDGGFSLIEVIVALGMLVVLMTALLPQLVVGIRSTQAAEDVTQAKGVAQGQLERMRNMPYHVARLSGPFLDVLDRYYTNLSPAPVVACMTGGDYTRPVTTWSGYVPGGSRCDYEPGSGPFYRYVVPHPASGVDPLDGFEVVVSTQFLDGATPPSVLTPPVGYDTQTAGRDRPVSTQVGVTVTVLSERQGTLRPVTTYTQIANLPSEVKRVQAAADATAIEIGSVLGTNDAVTLSAGLIDLTGSLSFNSEADADLAAVSAALATGTQESGAAKTLSAPTTASIELGAAGCLSDLACWGTTQLDLGPTSAAVGLPNAGSAASPMQSRLTSASFEFDNALPGDYLPRLDLTDSLVRLDASATPTSSGISASCGPGTTGGPSYIRSAGFLQTTPPSDLSAPSTVEACALSTASTISLFPTSFAPNGVVQVELRRASARCVVSGLGHTAQAPAVDYEAVVRYHVGDAPNSYQVATVVTPSMDGDQLAAVGLDVDVDGEDGDRTLGDYVASWSGLVASTLEKTHTGGVSAVRLPGVVHITSQPVRGTETAPPVATESPSPTEGPSPTESGSPTETPSPSDEPVAPIETVDRTSAFSVTAGVVGCSAQDAR